MESMGSAFTPLGDGFNILTTGHIADNLHGQHHWLCVSYNREIFARMKFGIIGNDGVDYHVTKEWNIVSLLKCWPSICNDMGIQHFTNSKCACKLCNFMLMLTVGKDILNSILFPFSRYFILELFIFYTYYLNDHYLKYLSLYFTLIL